MKSIHLLPLKKSAQKRNLLILLLCSGLLIVLFNVYTASAQTSNTQASSTAQNSILKAAWSNNVTISFSTNSFTFQSDGLPSHGVLDTYLGKGRDGFSIAQPVQAYNAEFSIPLNPVLAASPTQTNMGTVGVAVSGATFFNAFEGGADADIYAVEDNVTIEGIPFIDSCNGHGLPNGLSYHYHGIPYCISDAIDVAGEHSRIVGYMLDGFPIYGPQDVNGQAPTDLDACNSHFGPTPEYPQGIQHYHTTETAPYMANCYVGEVTITNRGPSAGGQGGGPPPQGGQGGPPGLPDFSAAAQQLGVSQEALMAALGGPPPDMVGAAQRLGITVERLMEVLPPPSGGPGRGPPPPPPGQ